jgi:hypothetical protein
MQANGSALLSQYQRKEFGGYSDRFEISNSDHPETCSEFNL